MNSHDLKRLCTTGNREEPQPAAPPTSPPTATPPTSVLPVKRSPSLNDSHYGSAAKSRLGPDSLQAEILKHVERAGTVAVKPSVETQTGAPAGQPEPTRPQPPVRGLNNEGFVRTGSGRKLPQIPDRSRCNTLPSRKFEEEAEEKANQILVEETTEGRKSSKPKAMEFWESMENIERNDFRYNTIHRMSMGRRLLPKPPDATHGRSVSMDRSESSNEAEKLSLNSSFSGPSSLPFHKSEGEGSLPASPRILHKIPADGASLQSQGEEGAEPVPGLDCRGEVEGSSNNNSPPTSVIQGLPGEDGAAVWELNKTNPNPAYDWVRGSFDRSSDSGRRKWGLPSPVTAVGTEYNTQDKKAVPADKEHAEKIVPYDVLLEDLSQAKRQLLELHNLVSSYFFTGFAQRSSSCFITPGLESMDN